MALVNLIDILDDARKNKYAVGAFDVSNYEMIKSVIEVAEEEKAPVILMGLKVDLDNNGISYWMPMAKKAAEKAKVPVCIHLDHSVDFEHIKEVIDQGYTSVMYDGSVLPFEENIANTKEVVDYAHQFGVSVEAELGHVGEGIAGYSETGEESQEGVLTQPSELKEFVERTGVDCLAVSIGTAHGVYISEPELSIDILKELNEISTVPLVLHGGSGTPSDQVQHAIEHGICKVNIFSEMLNAYYTEMRDFLNTETNMSVWPIVANEKPVLAMREVIRKKIRMFKSNGRGA